jgi:Ca2+-binding RTX toxin-like protein
MRKGAWSFVVLALLVASGNLAWAEPIPIQNPSFEAQVLGVGGFTNGTLTNWTLSQGNQGAYHPGTPQYPGGVVPDGANVAWSNGGTISQVLRHKLTAGIRYTLKVDIGNRQDTVGFPTYLVELRAGDVSVAATTTPSPAEGQFGTATAVSIVIRQDNPALGEVLEIRLVSNGNQVHFDNVRLDADIRRGFCDGLEATIVGTLGDDVLEGTEGDDVIVGIDGNDVIYGHGGNDVICGGDGNDILLGGDGNDILFGDAGNDILHGGAGNDQLLGGAGTDALFGDEGNDSLSGSSSNDYLNGGPGKDKLNGGSGTDVCDGGTDTATDTASACEPSLNIP